MFGSVLGTPLKYFRYVIDKLMILLVYNILFIYYIMMCLCGFRKLLNNDNIYEYTNMLMSKIYNETDSDEIDNNMIFSREYFDNSMNGIKHTIIMEIFVIISALSFYLFVVHIY